MDTGTFFGIGEACALAIGKWGNIARCWNDECSPDPSQRCRIGTGGMGLRHVVHGCADNWLDAARNAGLIERGGEE